MKKLADQIKLAQSGNEDAMMEIIEKFSPLIGKYTRLLNYDEDCRSELVLKLIALVKKEIRLDKMRSKEDRVFVKYISCSIRNNYILLAIANRRRQESEIAYDQDSFTEVLENNLQYSENIDDGMLMDTLSTILTEREFMCIRLIVLEGWTAEAVSRRLGVTKQAINQCKQRALAKLKEHYL